MKDFEKTLTIKQRMLWRAFKSVNKHKGADYEKLSTDEKKQVEQAFLNECLKRRIH